MYESGHAVRLVAYIGLVALVGEHMTRLWVCFGQPQRMGELRQDFDTWCSCRENVQPQLGRGHLKGRGSVLDMEESEAGKTGKKVALRKWGSSGSLYSAGSAAAVAAHTRCSRRLQNGTFGRNWCLDPGKDLGNPGHRIPGA